MNLRKALPNASFIGFTGTPLFKDDEFKIVGYEQGGGKDKGTVIKNIENRNELKEPTSGIMIDKVNKELSGTIMVLKKYFPNIDIELTHGIDKEDYVFLLKLKGIEK